MSLAPIENYPEYTEELWNFPSGYLSARGGAQGAVDQRHRARAWIAYRVPTRRLNVAAALLESYDSGLAYEAVGTIDSSPYVQPDPGYVTKPTSVRYFFTRPGAFRTDGITRTDLALTCTVPLFRTAELFVRPEILNLFNEKGVVAVDSTVFTKRNSSELTAFNPFTEKPVRGVHYDFPATFGKPTSGADYQLPRTFRVSVGVRF